ncbi:MAG: transcriptional regulator [Thermoplasmata archaeon]|jgi:putative transcriptional regulator|nr:transcriptional regulator [Thermoplasmata archaeon]
MVAKREELISRIRETLGKSGFFVSDPHNIRSISFDIIARRDKELLIIKALSNIDSLSSDDAEELRILASALTGSPMVIGLHSSSGKLDGGILYSRFGIPIISEETFHEHMLEGVPPFVYAAPGGLYVRLDGETLKRIRQEKNISLGMLAEIAGVSRKAIQMYESGMGAMIEIAAKIEEYLNEPIVMPLNPFSYTKEMARTLRTFDDFKGLNREVFEMLREIGYSVVPTIRCPFDALASEEDVLLLTGIEDNPSMTARKARVVGNISRVTEKKSVIFVRQETSIEAIDGTPLITKDELRRADDVDDVLELILQREKRKKA